MSTIPKPSAPTKTNLLPKSRPTFSLPLSQPTIVPNKQPKIKSMQTQTYASATISEPTISLSQILKLLISLLSGIATNPDGKFILEITINSFLYLLLTRPMSNLNILCSNSNGIRHRFLQL